MKFRKFQYFYLEHETKFLPILLLNKLTLTLPSLIRTALLDTNRATRADTKKQYLEILSNAESTAKLNFYKEIMSIYDSQITTIT